jgi:N-ethylmaleimide reductase
MNMNRTLSPYSKGALQLKNHLVMAPMTRNRAIDNLPNALMTEYYTQRNGAGLIITEGTSPAPEGLGYPRIPGIYSPEQVEGWKQTTAGIRAGGGRSFVQLMHTGRIGHPDNLPAGATVIGPSALRAAGTIYTDRSGMQEFPVPRALTTPEVEQLIDVHVKAAENAMIAGFDGVELHGANGYLIEQFLNPNSNIRTDEYGGRLERRARLAVETAQRIATAIGAGKLGIRFSPFNTFNDQQPYPESEVHAMYHYLAQEMDKISLAYLHIAVSPRIPEKTLHAIRRSFRGTIIQCSGLTPETAEAALHGSFADLVAFGKLFLANPDLDRRIAGREALNQPDVKTFYTPGAKGFTDYPVLQKTR